MSRLDDVLPLPDRVETRLICPDVLCLRQIVPSWGEELIEIADRIDVWQRSIQVLPGRNSAYEGRHRTSQSVVISSQHPDYGPCFRRFEEGLFKAFHTGVKAYLAYNQHMTVTDDSGYEMLRYREGEHFGCHVDAVVGRNEGFRQLSAVLYLNDDYTGGESHFPRQGLRFKGQAGDLLLFPSNFCYPHESLPVVKGTKYAVVTWFIAYPKKPVTQEEKESHDKANGMDSDAVLDPAGERVRLHESSGGGSPEREPAPSDREYPASIGGCIGQGARA